MISIKALISLSSFWIGQSTKLIKSSFTATGCDLIAELLSSQPGDSLSFFFLQIWGLIACLLIWSQILLLLEWLSLNRYFLRKILVTIISLLCFSFSANFISRFFSFDGLMFSFSFTEKEQVAEIRVRLLIA